MSRLDARRRRARRAAGPARAHRRRARALHRAARRRSSTTPPTSRRSTSTTSPPTAHPLPARATCCAPTRSRPSLDRDEVLAAAPAAEDGRFRVPRDPRRGAVSGAALEIAAAVRAGDRSAARRASRSTSPSSPRAKPRSTPSTSCSPTRRAPRPTRSTPRSARGRRPGPAGRRAGRAQGQPLHARHPHHVLVADPRGLAPAVRRDGRRARASPPARSSIGKTNLDEFAMGSSTENSAFGPDPQPARPDPGARRLERRHRAAAVAAGFAPLALGSDTGGSIRQPAALCGVVGVKPTYGARVALRPRSRSPSSLDQIGPFATTVADAALLLEVIGGHDPLRLDVDRRAGAAVARRRSSDGVDGPARRHRRRAHRRRRHRRPTCAHAVDAAADALEAAGAKVDEVSVPGVDLRPLGVLPDRAGRGVEQPGPLRRRALRPARRRRRRRATMNARDPRRPASAPR